jgi:endonuclease/exonuclease/phosphatase family metal-dependent hydrolase
MNAVRRRKIAGWVGGSLLSGVLLLGGLIWFSTFHPRDGQREPVFCDPNAPMVRPGQPLKVLSYNVQFLAGKGHVFFFDLPGDAGPDERPSPADIACTTEEVARIIRDEDPDVVLLQEVDDGAKRTDHEDQLARLLSRLPPEYACHCSTFYWKAAFVPHGRIMGSVGMKLSIISKYRIAAAVRHSLPAVPRNPLVRQFHPKRAILEARLPMTDGRDLVVLNLHFEAFPQGSDVMGRQVARLDSLLTDLERSGCPWVTGGDFNLLPPGQSAILPPGQAVAYRRDSEMAVLYAGYQVLPRVADVMGPAPEEWLTHFPNDPGISAPDRTIDYIVLPVNARVSDVHVRRRDTLSVSDHLPLCVTIEIPP